MNKGFHAIVLYLLLSIVYGYALVCNLPHLTFILIVFGIAFISGKVTELIPSYEFLVETLDKFWMKMLVFSSVITPGIIYDSFNTDDVITQLIIRISIIMVFYIIPCIVMYKFSKPEFTYTFRLGIALRNLGKSKCEILELILPSGKIQVLGDRDYLEGHVYYPSHMINIQMAELKNNSMTLLIPIDLDKETYIKVIWDIDKNLDVKQVLDIEFEKAWRIMNKINNIASTNDIIDSKDVINSFKLISTSEYPELNIIELADKYEFKRLNFSRNYV